MGLQINSAVRSLPWETHPNKLYVWKTLDRNRFSCHIEQNVFTFILTNSQFLQTRNMAHHNIPTGFYVIHNQAGVSQTGLSMMYDDAIVLISVQKFSLFLSESWCQQLCDWGLEENFQLGTSQCDSRVLLVVRWLQTYTVASSIRLQLPSHSVLLGLM